LWKPAQLPSSGRLISSGGPSRTELFSVTGYQRRDRPKSCEIFLGIPAFCVLLGEITDTLNYNWDYAYVNEFPYAVEEFDLDK